MCEHPGVLSLKGTDQQCDLSVFRYEVNFQSGIDCGGAYVKLLTETPDLDLVSAIPTHVNSVY